MTLLQRTLWYDTTPIAVAEGPVLGSEFANKIKRLVLIFVRKKTGQTGLETRLAWVGQNRRLEGTLGWHRTERVLAD